MNKKWLLSVSLLLLAFVIVGCSGNDDDSAEGDNKESEPETEEGAEQPEMPEPDLEDIPDVVAEVNGKEILKEEFEATFQGEFQRAQMQAQMSGEEVDQDQLKGQIIEGLIGQELIIQEAENNGFDASEEAINETLDDLVEQNGLESQEDLFAAFADQGMDKEEIMSQVEANVKVDKLIASQSGNEDPTDKELQEIYDAYTAQLEQVEGKGDEEVEIPTFEEMESDLIEQAKAEKRSETYLTLVEELEADADITNHL